MDLDCKNHDERIKDHLLRVRDATFPFLNGFPFFFTKPKNSVFFF